MANNKVALKSGIWYTGSTFLIKALAFISAPIFTRLLSEKEYGDFNVFATWISLLFIICSCDFQTSIIRSKTEFKESIDKYVSSVLVLSTLITLSIYVITYIFKDFLFSKIFLIDEGYIHFMFIYLLLSTAWQMFASKCRAFYKYKLVTAITFSIVVVSLLSSLVLVYTMNDKLTGRIIGQYIPEIIIGIVFYFVLILKGRCINKSYWKYALKMCIPLVPHLLSLSLLSSSDKIIIKNLCGSEKVAIYSIAVMCAHILSLLLDAMNKAWAPWFLDSLHDGNKDSIYNASKYYFGFFLILSIMVILFAPEIITLLGGKKYYNSIQFIPPLIVGCVYQILYTLFVQCEIYEKKTIGVAIGTLGATAINIILNYLFIPLWGVTVASFTTLLGYFFLMFFHFVLINKLGYKQLFDIKFLGVGILALTLMIPIAYLAYNYTFLRYSVILLFFVTLCLILFINRIQLMKMLKGFLKRK